MSFREATIRDIDDIMVVRFSVLENVLNTPGLVTEKDCEEYLTRRGKGWVCEIDGQVVGFSIVDLQAHNIWCLFVRPEQEARGVGKAHPAVGQFNHNVRAAELRHLAAQGVNA